VILLDLVMPGLGGEEVSLRLKADQVTGDIPIVAMSAHERLLLSAAKLPVDDHLPKPFHLRHLLETVGRWAGPARASPHSRPAIPTRGPL
jgi:CheY-like chemotaxis protein